MGNRIIGHFCGKVFITGHNEGYPKREVERTITQKLHRSKQRYSTAPLESTISEGLCPGCGTFPRAEKQSTGLFGSVGSVGGSVKYYVNGK